MLLTRNVTRNSVFTILSYDTILNIVNRCLVREISVKCRRNIGYPAFHFKQYLNENNNVKTLNYKLVKHFSSSDSTGFSNTLELTPVQFEKVSDETLESLCEYFDELIEKAAHLLDADVSYGDGVLTIKFGNLYGTYVINRQTPNKQIWLSSPKSGPKRYDFINGKWIYKHDGKTLHELLNDEIPAIIRDQVNFHKCSFSGKEREAALKSL
ncbi:Frataxin-like protein, mitochondrial [Habropoda laboriosa]|uniref:ferroxidase n=1 Tax=Habropoda laboriosa TaxID=597456 RepID=A0A0L7QL80_9HYME|nr:PREDICTED: frataxin homolog, mitochondrial [Habropoda laboriosa]KOC59372.1 Frataxin-like protein, mitochondrial [Habropoda laboriosa]